MAAATPAAFSGTGAAPELNASRRHTVADSMTPRLKKGTITASGVAHPVKAPAAHEILRNDRVRATLHLTGLSIALLATVYSSLMVGRYHVPFSTWWQMLTAPRDSGVAGTVLLAVRLPRIVASVLIGGGLAAAGAGRKENYDAFGEAGNSFTAPARPPLLFLPAWMRFAREGERRARTEGAARARGVPAAHWSRYD